MRSEMINGEARYAVDLTIVEIVVLPIMPGTFFVEVSINGTIFDQTARTKLTRGKLIWNKNLTLYFKEIEPRSPIMITLSIYKKKVLSFGYHLVGSFHFATADLVGTLDRGAWRTRANLHLRKNQLTIKGSIILVLNVRCVRQSGGFSSTDDSRSMTSIDECDRSPARARLATADDKPTNTDQDSFLYSASQILFTAILCFFSVVRCRGRDHNVGRVSCRRVLKSLKRTTWRDVAREQVQVHRQ
jgi:hypothetical protein